MLRIFLLSTTLLSMSAFAEPVDSPIAEEKAKKTTKINVEMKVVSATKNGTKFDPKLNALKRHFKDLVYTNYKLLGTKRAKLAERDHKEFDIQGNRKVKVTVVKHNAKNARLKIEIHGPKNKKLLSSTMMVRRDSTPVIVALSDKKGGKLLLPFSVEY